MVRVCVVAASSPTRNVTTFWPSLSVTANDQRPTESVVVCSSNQKGMSRVMIEPGAAIPRTSTTFWDTTLPLTGSTITRPMTGMGGPIVPSGRAEGDIDIEGDAVGKVG